MKKMILKKFDMESKSFKEFCNYFQYGDLQIRKTDLEEQLEDHPIAG